MENKKIARKTKKKHNIEFWILIIFLINHLFMAVGSLALDWDSWIGILMVFTGASSIVVYASKAWNYEIRVVYVEVMLNVCIMLYGTQADHIMSIIVPYIAIVIISAFYSIPGIVVIPFISGTFLIVYQMFVLNSFSIHNAHDYFVYGIPISNFYLSILAVYILTKIWNKNKKDIDNIIADLKKAEQSKDDFLANISHEIRTPVNSVTGMSEIILREDLPDNVRENVKNIQVSGNRLVSIVSDILDFSELTSGKTEITEKPYCISDVVNHVIAIVEPLFKDRNVEFVIDVDCDIPNQMIGDALKIERVLLNIVNNAIKFTNEGLVTIKISSRKEVYGVNLSIVVEDTGIGIEDQAVENLFTVFNQVDTKRNRQREGLGLGLAISKAIIEKMNGFISFNSKVGVGTRVRLVIPQKIVDNTPLIDASKYKTCSVLNYIDVEQFDDIRVRDAYVNSYMNLVDKLGIQSHTCMNLAELKRRVKRDYITHIYISLTEYLEDEKFFDNLSKKIMVIVCIGKDEDRFIHSRNLVKIYRPFSVLELANLFLGEKGNNYNKKFIAPDAKLLIVDDNLINLKVISGLLKPYKMELVLVESGKEALNAIESMDFDMILLDHMMPEMDGIEVLKRIRAKENHYFKEIPIIALTANAVAGAREMFIQEGFQEFVSKPVEITYLNNVIKSYISSSKIVFIDDEIDEADEKPLETSFVDESEANTIHEEKTIEQDNDSFEANVNVEQGSMYCGSYDDFLEVLRIHLDDGAENSNNIQQYYEKKDWKNYTILVHGLKSSMKSVGIERLSEMARLLESAGKTEDEKYILENHNIMMEEYKRIIKILCKFFGAEEVVSDNETNINDSEKELVELESLVELSDEEFDELLLKMEEATFSWDGDALMRISESLAEYKYHDNSMKKIADSITKKIEMSDYMSAYESLKAWRDKQN